VTLHQRQTHPEYVPGCFGCRVSSVSVSGLGNQDRTRQKAWDSELDRYEAARNQGIQPDGTSTTKILAAERWSEKHQQPYSQDLATKTKQLKTLERLL